MVLLISRRNIADDASDLIAIDLSDLHTLAEPVTLLESASHILAGVETPWGVLVNHGSDLPWESVSEQVVLDEQGKLEFRPMVPDNFEGSVSTLQFASDASWALANGSLGEGDARSYRAQRLAGVVDHAIAAR